MTSFSLITPVYNNPEEVRKLLESLGPEALKDPALEVIVVDDCSSGEAMRRVVEKSGFAKYVRLNKNSGPAHARNIGAKLAKNEILIFVDSDVVLNSDTLSKIRDKFDKDSRIKIFGGEYDIEPANPSLSTKFKSLMVRSWSPRENFVTDFLTRLGVIRKDIFDELGGFDTAVTTASVEDYEFARKLINKGYVIYYDPDVTVKHHFPAFKKQIKLFFHRAFMWIYIFKKYGKFDNTCTTPIGAVSQICGAVTVMFLISSMVNAGLIFPGLFFLILFMLANLRFFKLSLKHEGLIFTLKAIPMALIIACSVVFGALLGIIYFFLFGAVVKKS